MRSSLSETYEQGRGRRQALERPSERASRERRQSLTANQEWKVVTSQRKGELFARRLSGGGALVVAAVLLIAACSGGDGPGSRHADRGERLIEDVVASQLGLGPLSASCEADDALVFGDQFSCTGVSNDGREVVFLATIADGGAIDVTSLNLITNDVIASIEGAAIDSLRRSDGLEVAENGFKCGVGPVVFPVGEEFAMLCRVVHPSTGLVHSAAVEITDLANLELRVIISPNPEPN